MKEAGLEILENKILQALEEIRPFLVADGGDVVLKEITGEMDVIVELTGACKTCNMNAMTMQAGVQQTIKKFAPEVNKVVSISC